MCLYFVKSINSAHQYYYSRFSLDGTALQTVSILKFNVDFA